MQITHSKVSGETNPVGGAVGGEDWDDPHVVTGLRLVGLLECTDNNGTFTVQTAIGVPSYCIARLSQGRYGVYLDDAGLPPNNCHFVASVELNDNAAIEPLAFKSELYPTGGPIGGGEYDLVVYRNSSGTMLTTLYCKFKLLIYRTD